MKSKYKYYHEGNFKRILKLISDNYFNNALVELDKYLETYPNDVCAHAYYAELLIRMGNFEEAESILNNIDVDTVYNKTILDYIIMLKVKLYSCIKEYQKAYELFSENIAVFKTRFGADRTDLFFRRKLNLLTVSDLGNTGYLVSQLVNYSEENCLDHLVKHLYNIDNDNSCQFVETFPLKEFYYQMREMLPLDGENKVYNSIIDNSYVFKYEHNGKVDGKWVDYIQVVTIGGSNDIITMYPYENRERIPAIDLTPKVEELPKVKRMSQIDKFNQRYYKN